MVNYIILYYIRSFITYLLSDSLSDWFALFHSSRQAAVRVFSLLFTLRYVNVLYSSTHIVNVVLPVVYL